MPKPKYFAHFPKEQCDFFGFKNTITNLNRYIRISPDVAESRYAFYDYVIKEGERPDHVAYSAYGDSKYYWTILVVNNIRDIWREWPMTNKEFENYIISKYDSVTSAQSTTHSYVSNEGIVIDHETAMSLSSTDYTIITQYDYEHQLNEEKRDIKLIQPQYIAQFQTDIENVFSEGA